MCKNLLETVSETINKYISFKWRCNVLMSTWPNIDLWWTASIKPRLLFSHAGYAFWGISLFSVDYNIIIGRRLYENLYDVYRVYLSSFIRKFSWERTCSDKRGFTVYMYTLNLWLILWYYICKKMYICCLLAGLLAFNIHIYNVLKLT